MKLLRLVLLSILVSSCTGEDFLISDANKHQHLIVNEDLTLIRKFDFKFNGPPNKMKVIKAKKGWMVYDLEDSEITMYTVSDEGRVSKSGTIIINKDVKDKIKDFDVQPSGELLAIISGNTIYSFSQKDNKATPILTPDSKPEVVFIHPTERLIYYTNCAQPIGATLKIFDMSSKTEKQHRIHSCRFDIDFKENMLWFLDINNILKQNLNEGKPSETITSINNGFYKTSALSSDHMFFMLSENNIDVYKMKTSLKLQKQLSLADYAIEPVLTRIHDANPAVFNVEKSMIEVLDPSFEKIIKQIKINFDAKPIRTIRYIYGITSTIFFWIHDSNKGKVEYVKVARYTNVDVEKRGSFQVPTDGDNIIDFVIDKIPKTFCFATASKIVAANIDISIPVGGFTTTELPFEGTIKGLGMRYDDGRLIVSYCDKSGSALDVIYTYWGYETKQTLTQGPRCSQRIFVDEQVKKDNRILASSTRGLYNLGFNGEVEQLSNLKESFGNFLLDGNHVYFVSKTDGPGIYKIEKRRIAKIDLKLPLADNGNFEIMKVKGSQTKVTNIPNKPGGGPIGKPEQPKGNLGKPQTPDIILGKPLFPGLNLGNPLNPGKPPLNSDFYPGIPPLNRDLYPGIPPLNRDLYPDIPPLNPDFYPGILPFNPNERPGKPSKNNGLTLASSGQIYAAFLVFFTYFAMTRF